MPDAIHRALLEALLGCLVFLEDSGDDIVDPDGAVRAMENAAHRLLSLPEADRAELVAMIRRLGAAESDGPWRRYILRTPYMIGLVEDERPAS